MQFLTVINYDILVDTRTDDTFDKDLNYIENEKVLSSIINVHKAMGPDMISGKVLKNCAKSLLVPLSIIFS